MEIPGLASYTGQPTVTNPLDQEARLKGQRARNTENSETKETLAAKEQSTQQVDVKESVEQGNETNASEFKQQNLGSNIDYKV